MVALHEPSKHGDDRNYHAHILMTTRRMEADGLGQKTRELDDNTQGKAEVLHIREHAADLINAALEQTGSNERIDHRSFQDRGIDEDPTEHLGVEASAMERRDEKTRKGERNREIKQRNQTLKALAQQSEELDRQIQQEEAQSQKRQQEREERKEQQRAQATKKQTEAKPAPEPKAKKAKTHWQDKIKAERETSSDNEGGGTTAAPLTTEQSQTPASPTVYHSPYSSINNPVTIAHAQQIAKYGEIQHKGLIKSWVEHILDWTQELQGGVSDAWEILKDEAKGGGDYDLYDPSIIE
jgi:septal ring factor EnvC (AmiA/AmiB activator)